MNRSAKFLIITSVTPTVSEILIFSYITAALKAFRSEREEPVPAREMVGRSSGGSA